MRVVHVAGARPNFMKLAAVWHALAARPSVEQLVVHTGQHYDANMSGVFFDQLAVPAPEVNLEVGSGPHGRQTAAVMSRFEEYLETAPRPDWVLVYGDVNSTVAAALVCAKQLVPLAHVEAGLRSFDRTMPEEVNRLVTDRLADLLLTPSEDGDANLAREGVPPEKIRRVGNVMIDTLVRLLPAAEARAGAALAAVGVEAGRPYVLVTLHRPSNVDEPARLAALMAALGEIAREATVVFPVHPRTRARLASLAVVVPPEVRLAEPLGYLEFLALQKGARLVVTDSGGMQEETTWLGVRCLTMRTNTERPITVTLGTNTLVGHDTARLVEEARRTLAGPPAPRRPQVPLWDGHAGERVAAALAGE